MAVQSRPFGWYLGILALVLTVQLAFAGGALGAITSVPDSPLVTNGSVNAFAVQDNTLYVGGTFDRIGPRSGPFVSVSSSSGTLDPGLPQVSGGSGDVEAIAADGSGGWYIGGNFTHVGGVSRLNLAHVLADGSVDPSFHPDPDSDVEDLVLSGSTLYVSGAFSSIGGQPRASLAALDAATGTPTAWQANADSDVFKIALSGDGSTLYALGSFGTIGHNSASRARLAAIDTTTGDATAWDPHPTDASFVDLEALTVSGSTVYVGGHFDHIGNTPVPRSGLAALNATGSGDATSWDPNPTSSGFREIDAIAVSGSTVYVGGSFDQIGSQPRLNLAAIDATSGNPTSWRPDPNDAVQAIAVAGSTVYAAGSFDHVGQSAQAARHGAAAIDTSSGDPTSWDPDPNILGEVYDLVVAGGHVGLGGEFSALGGSTRSGVAAVDLATGSVTPFDPVLSSSGQVIVDALAVSGSTLYVGGTFDHVGQPSKPLQNLAAIDAGTGQPLDWGPQPDGDVTDLAVAGGQVYAAGSFSQIGANGASRAGLAALDPVTASATSWAPDPGPNTVIDMAVSGSTLYLGGAFSTIAGTTRNHAAAFSVPTGSLLSWDPDTDDFVDALAVDGPNVYLGGVFRTVHGDPRQGLAAVDATSGIPNGWSPSVDNAQSLAVTGGAVYFGGQNWGFGSPTGVNGVPRNQLAAVDETTGALLPWDPNLADAAPQVITAGPAGTLFVGGSFQTTDLAANSNLALFGVPTGSSSGGGGGGAGGGGVGSTPTNPAVPPRLHLSLRRLQRILHQHDALVVSVVSNQDGTLKFSATVSVPKRAKVLRFKIVRRQVKANRRVRVQLKLSKTSLKLVRRALAHHKTLRAKVRVTDTSKAHLSSTRSLTVWLRR